MSDQSYPPISHESAEALISARMDQLLSPAENQRLLAHLAACAECRAFAVHMEIMSHGLRSLDSLPASPAVARQVRERMAMEPAAGVWRVGPARSRWLASIPAAAMTLLVAGALVALAVSRLGGDGNDGEVSAPPSRTVAFALPATATASTATGETAPAPEVTFVQQDEPTTAPITAAMPNVTVKFTPSPPTAASESGIGETPVDPVLATGPTGSEPIVSAALQAAASPETTGKTSESPASTPSPEPTASPPPAQSPTDAPTATLEPTQTPTDEPTATLEPTQTPTDEPTATLEPTQTPTDAPTATLEPAESGTTQMIVPSSGKEAVGVPEATVEPVDLPPTIAPIGSAATEEPVAPAETTQEIGNAVATEQVVESDSSTIVPVDGAEVSGFDPVDAAGGGDPGTSEPAENGAVLLDAAELVVTLDPGVAAPEGQLAIEPELREVFAVISPFGQLAIADMSGAIRVELGSGSDPVWSDFGGLMAYTDYSQATPSVAVWDRNSGVTYMIAAGTAEPGRTIDLAAGFSGTSVMFQRTYVDQPGVIELHLADSQGVGDSVIWSAEGIEPVTNRPVVTRSGILIATGTDWLLIGFDGLNSSAGSNPFGTIGQAVVSPGGSLVAYEAGGTIQIASVDAPGVPLAGAIPFAGGPGSGFAFSPDGLAIVVSDGLSLQIYGVDGSFAASASSSSGAPIGGPRWLGDGIYFVEQGDPSSLKLLDPAPAGE